MKRQQAVVDRVYWIFQSSNDNCNLGMRKFLFVCLGGGGGGIIFCFWVFFFRLHEKDDALRMNRNAHQ